MRYLFTSNLHHNCVPSRYCYKGYLCLENDCFIYEIKRLNEQFVILVVNEERKKENNIRLPQYKKRKNTQT